MKKLEYEVISEGDHSLEIKLQECGHTVKIGKVHIKDGNFICNTCSNLNNDSHMYHYENGVQHKSTMVRQCRICEAKDAMDRLISIPQPIKNGRFSFWFFHESCIKEQGHTVEAIRDILQDATVKNKTARLQNKDVVSKPAKKPTEPVKDVVKRRYEPMLNRNSLRQLKKIENNKGEFISGADVGLRVINRSVYDIASFNGLCGVYSIHNWRNGKRYIGSARHLRQRFKQHMTMLEQGNHHSYKLQSGFNEGNTWGFEFEILEILDNDCSIDALHLTEQKYIDLSNSINFGYNVNPIAE